MKNKIQADEFREIYLDYFFAQKSFPIRVSPIYQHNLEKIEFKALI